MDFRLAFAVIEHLMHRGAIKPLSQYFVQVIDGNDIDQLI
jgi:hypothetical protein